MTAASDPVDLRWRDDVDDAQWKALLEADPRACDFQAPWFVRALAVHHPGWHPRFLEARDASGHLVAGLPFLERRKWGLRSWASGFAGSYGGPVAAPGARAAEAALARAFVGGGWRVVRRELVWGRTEAPRGAWPGLQPLDTSALFLDLDVSFDENLQRNFPKNRRNEGNRSDRRGLRVAIEPTGQHLDAVYAIYLDRCRRWKSPPVPIGVLREFLEVSERSALFVAFEPGDEVVGGHVVLDTGDELFAWVGTTLRRERTFPATVLVREEARWCHANGRSRLNLGASGGLSGVENYKKLLGAGSSPRWILRWRRGGSRR